VVGREVGLPSSGYADVTAFEPDGRPVIIEVKLRNNAESRRAVLAQPRHHRGPQLLGILEHREVAATLEKHEFPIGDGGRQEPAPLGWDRVQFRVDHEGRRLDAGESPDRVERTQAAHHPLRTLLHVSGGDLSEPKADPLDGCPVLEERDEGVELVALQGLWLPGPELL